MRKHSPLAATAARLVGTLGIVPSLLRYSQGKGPPSRWALSRSLVLRASGDGRWVCDTAVGASRCACNRAGVLMYSSPWRHRIAWVLLGERPGCCSGGGVLVLAGWAGDSYKAAQPARVQPPCLKGATMGDLDASTVRPMSHDRAAASSAPSTPHRRPAHVSPVTMRFEARYTTALQRPPGHRIGQHDLGQRVCPELGSARTRWSCPFR